MPSHVASYMPEWVMVLPRAVTALLVELTLAERLFAGPLILAVVATSTVMLFTLIPVPSSATCSVGVPPTIETVYVASSVPVTKTKPYGPVQLVILYVATLPTTFLVMHAGSRNFDPATAAAAVAACSLVRPLAAISTPSVLTEVRPETTSAVSVESAATSASLEVKPVLPPHALVASTDAQSKEPKARWNCDFMERLPLGEAAGHSVTTSRVRRSGPASEILDEVRAQKFPSAQERCKKKAMSASSLMFRYGCHRVLEPQGALPQAAWRLDSRPEHELGAEHELVIAVERLNIDAASFRQMEHAAQAAGEDIAAGVARRVRETVASRGKMHNPVTGSGGMLLGRVARVGSQLGSPHRELVRGESIATLVSLTLTPLCLDEIMAVHVDTHQIDVQGTAVLFSSGMWSRLPDFMPESATLSALDVAGAGPQVARLCRQLGARRVLILGGGGKSGVLCAAAAHRAGAEWIVGIESAPRAAQEAAALPYYSRVLSADAADPLALAQLATAAASASGEPAEYDLVVSCVSAPHVELAAILCTRERGTVYFFSMATSFTAAALGAEGVSKDIDMLIGNGFCVDHAAQTLDLLRSEPPLQQLFVRRYSR